MWTAHCLLTSHIPAPIGFSCSSVTVDIIYSTRVSRKVSLVSPSGVTSIAIGCDNHITSRDIRQRPFGQTSECNLWSNWLWRSIHQWKFALRCFSGPVDLAASRTLSKQNEIYYENGNSLKETGDCRQNAAQLGLRRSIWAACDGRRTAHIG